MAGLLLVSALLFFVPSLGLGEGESMGDLGSCHACAGCEEGACDEAGSPGDEHCCPTTCLGHLSVALTGSQPVQAPVSGTLDPRGDASDPLSATPRAPDRPPRA